MQVIGVVGGIASGKSLVTQQLADRGAGALDADRAGHEALHLPEVEAAARARWGEGIFGPDGRIDRKRLAGIVFAPPPTGPRERQYLEQLTHPEIGRRLERQAEKLAACGKRVAVVDAALLFEAGWDRLCDHIVFVDAPRETRLARARTRGWSEEEFVAREGAQESLDYKRARSDVIIDNSGTPELTEAQVERFWHRLAG
jgi:dephospho-CoA kinase